MYEFFARLQGLPTINVPLLAGDGFAVNFQLLEQQPAKIFFLCSPNNPTGSVVDPQEILKFASRVEERALVVLDEAYIEFSEFDSLARQATQRSNLVVLRTLSKAWSLAGARLGVVIASQELIRYLQATTSPYPLSRAAVASALSTTGEQSLATAEKRIHDIRLQRERLQQALQMLGFVRHVYPSQANFLLLHVQDAARLMEFTRRQGILLRDQSSQPEMANHVRISIGTPSEMDRLMESLYEFAGESP
jgi:histidinol-phosphate aminotransferase